MAQVLRALPSMYEAQMEFLFLVLARLRLGIVITGKKTSG